MPQHGRKEYIMAIKKDEILAALKIKLETELFYNAVGESFCEDLITFVKRSPREEFDRAETNFLVNNALSEVFFHGGRPDRVKLCRVLQHACWTDISDEEIGLAVDTIALPLIF